MTHDPLDIDIDAVFKDEQGKAFTRPESEEVYVPGILCSPRVPVRLAPGNGC